MFVKGPNNQTLWQPKPKSPAEIKAASNDQKAARLAKAVPTSGKQSIISAGMTKQFGPGKFFKAKTNSSIGSKS
jgi:hypothetical protein